MVWWMEGLYSFTLYSCTCASLVVSVMSNFLWTCELEPARLLCPWDSPGKNNGVGCHAVLQGIFKIQESNLVSYVSYTGRFLTTSATWEALFYTQKYLISSMYIMNNNTKYLSIWYYDI